MKNKIIALCLFLLITASMTSCVKDDTSNTTTDNTLSITGTAASYNKSELPQQDKFNNISEMCYNSNTNDLFIFNAGTDGKINCILTDNTFEIYNSIILELSLKNNDLISFDIWGDCIYAVITHIDYDENNMQAESFSYTLVVLDKNGKIISTADFSIADDIFISSNNFRIVQNVKIIDENKMLISVGSESIIADTSGNITAKIEINADEMLSDIVRTADGNLLCLVSSKFDTKLCEINTEEYTLSNTFRLPMNNVTMICGDEKYTAYIYDGLSVYGLTADNILNKVIDIVGSGLTNTRKLISVGNGNFVGLSDGKFILISEKAPNEISEIQEISLGTVHLGWDHLSAISEFNSQSTKYKINVIDYFEGMEESAAGIEEAELRLELDIISGKAPDILLCDSKQAQKLSCKGAFDDLYAYIDNDEKLSRSSFLPNVLDALETKGKLYSISPTFAVDTVAAKSKFVNKENWNFEDMQRIYSTLPADMTLFTQGNNKQGILDLITCGGSNFIDYENMTCKFDSEDFINALEFAAQFPKIGEMPSDYQYTYNDTALLSTFFVNDFREFNTKKKSEFGDDITFVGYPTSNGQGSGLSFGQRLAITNNSTNKEGAWSFIREYLLSYNPNCMSVISDFFDIQVQAATERPYFINSAGTKEYWDEIISLPDGNNLKIEPMSIDESRFYSNFIKSLKCSSSNGTNSDIYNIIEEESTLFFEGINTSDQCAKMIQSRISLMLDEQR